MRVMHLFLFCIAAAASIGTATYGNVMRARESAMARRLADLECLARNVYYEARGEPLAGQYAVAEVTMNRVRSPDFPETVCDVVHAGRDDAATGRRIAAFSWTAHESHAAPQGYQWRRARAVASTVYDSAEAPLVEGALFYHATYVTPEWSQSKMRVARIGRHLFYE